MPITIPGRLSAGVLMLSLCCGFPAATWAQRVYKQVGPDGKVTFTDQPPPGQEPPPLRPTAPAIEAASPDLGQADVPGRGPKKAAKKAIRREEATPDAAAAAPLDPAVEKGLTALMGFQSLVSSYRELCLRTLPTSFKRYDGAAQAWENRHAAVLARYPVVLKDNFSPADQAAMRQAIANRTQSMMAPVAAADTAHRIKWCDSTAAELDAGKVDLPQRHTDALMKYASRR